MPKPTPSPSEDLYFSRRAVNVYKAQPWPIRWLEVLALIVGIVWGSIQIVEWISAQWNPPAGTPAETAATLAAVAALIWRDRTCDPSEAAPPPSGHSHLRV